MRPPTTFWRGTTRAPLAFAGPSADSRFPPTFTFLPWLVGLLVAVGLLGVLTPVAFAGTRWLRPIAYFLAIIHLANGLLHIVGSVVERRLVPGVLSAPLLLATSIWLGYATAQLK